MHAQPVHFGYPVWEIVIAILCIASTIPATHGVIWYVKAKARAMRRTRAMWRELNEISRGGYMRERARV